MKSVCAHIWGFMTLREDFSVLSIQFQRDGSRCVRERKRQ